MYASVPSQLVISGNKKTKLVRQKPLSAEEAFKEAWLAGPCGKHRMEFVEEHRFSPTRMFRFDFAIPIARIAIEIEGRGRHQTVVGYRNDTIKYNLANILGWWVFRFPATDIRAKDEWGESRLENFVEQLCEFLLKQKPVEGANITTSLPRSQANPILRPRDQQSRDQSQGREPDAKIRGRAYNARGLLLRRA